MILRRVISGDPEGRGPLYAIVQIEDGATCSACRQELLVGAPALFRVDDVGRTTLIHPACRPGR